MKIMLAAPWRQPNISIYIKQGLPSLQAIIEHFEAAKRDECEARQKLTSFVALSVSSSSQREASASPLAPTVVQKTAKKKKKEEGEAIEPASQEWNVVHKQKQKNKKPPEQKAQEQKGEERGKTLTKPTKRRPRAEAIALKLAKGKTYAETLGGFRSKVEPSKCDVGIKTIRKTRSDEVLIELIKPTAVIKKSFTDALKNAVGENASVRVLTPKATMEISDMDSCTTMQEVSKALHAKLQDHEGQIEVSLTKPNAVGQCIAVFCIEEKAAAHLLDMGRIPIGWVYCRLRRREQVTRCFRCLEYGHVSRACKGSDRSTLCFKRGGGAHKAVDCTARPMCFLCSGTGTNTEATAHVAGSGVCRAFREALVRFSSSS